LEAEEFCIMRSFITCTLYRVVKWKSRRFAGHVARKGEVRNSYNILIGKPEGNRPLKDLDIDGRLTLEWIKLWTGFIWLRIGTSGGLLWTQ
jgi:hypothetical protein